MPSNEGPARHRKTSSQGQSGRFVVPAIPLPHAKRQAAAAANRSANANVNTGQPKPSATGRKRNSDHGKLPKAVDNQASNVQANFSKVQDNEPTPSASQDTGQATAASSSSTAQKDSPLHDTTNTEKKTAGSMSKEDPSVAHSGNNAAPLQSVIDKKMDVPRSSVAPEYVNGAHDKKQPDAAHHLAGAHGQAQEASPAPSSAKQKVAASFHADQHPNTADIGVPEMASADGRYQMHRHHLSNSGLHFGALNDSGTSSPGLSTPAGFGPPPGMRMPDHPGFVPHNGNGISQTTTGNPDMIPGLGFDNHGRPNIPFGPGDVRQLAGNGFAPSTPQSFHDSQSSVQQDDTAFYQQVHPGPPLNGDSMSSRPFPESIPQALHRPPPILHPTPPLAMPFNGNQALALVSFVHQAWLNGQYTDCLLEVQDQVGRQERLPVHQMVIAQSPVLNKRLSEQAQIFQGTVSPQTPVSLGFKIDNKWFSVESLKLVINHLYGLPLPNPNFHGPLSEIDRLFMAGPPRRCFFFALSYAAGGYVFGVDTVLRRGAELATQCLDASTIENAMAFAVEGHVDKGTHDHFQYGDAARIMLHTIVAFVASSLSYSFQLDISVTSDRNEYSRLPHDSPSTSKTENVIVKGNGSGHLSKGSNSQKPLNIQFGDLSLSDGRYPYDNGIPDAVVSRILLNLPFSSLKLLIEAGPNATAELRRDVVQATVREREARRLRALDAILDGRVAEVGAALEVLRTPEPRQVSEWSILGWCEELNDSAEGPSLVREWQPLKLPPKSSGAAYP
jgi:hypothetical protein